MNTALADLERCLDVCLLRKIKLFLHVTDLYGQIYIARDTGVRKKQNKEKVTA